jgi:hypothetical protein
VQVGEILAVRVQLASGQWVSGGWAGIQESGSPEPGKKADGRGRDIGDMMLERGCVTARELQNAREHLAAHPGEELGQMLIYKGYAGEQAVAEARAAALNLRFINLETMTPHPYAITVLPLELARRFRVIPVMRQGDDLLVAVADLPDPSLADAIRLETGYRVTFGIATKSVIEKYLKVGFGGLHVAHDRALRERAKERARELDLPFLDVRENPPSADAAALIPGFMAWRYRAIPVRREGSQLLVACIDPLDPLMTQQLELASGCTVHAMLGEAVQINELLTRWYGSGDGIPPYIGLGQNDPAEQQEWEAASEIARASGLVVVHLPTLKPTGEALAAVPEGLARRFRCVPVLKRGDTLLVAAEDPGNPDLIPTLEWVSGCDVRLAVGLPGQIQDALRDGYGGDEGDNDNGGAPVFAPTPPHPPAPPEYQPVTL